MEWTKETLINKCIKCNNPKHAKRVIKFFESFGFINSTENYYHEPCYYGVRNDGVILFGSKVYAFETEIKLPITPRRKFPREMMVSDNKLRWNKRIVVAKVKTKWPIIALKINFDLNDEFIEYRSWKYAKEID